mmetsp:Transcript_27440/g.79115  ORF Transcript_27440/g.79115 Transcript_27440/m.79115 type:complete len:579 (-) Transcript_27440:198-1934(-)
MPRLCQYGTQCHRSDCHFSHPRGKTAAKEMCSAPPSLGSCKYGSECFQKDCHFSHPASWVCCGDGGECPYSDCLKSHPPRRPPCKSEETCTLISCHFLHPRSWSRSAAEHECPEGSECPFSDCTLSHPHRPAACVHGASCLRPKDECRYIHPRAWHSEEVSRKVCRHGEACSREGCYFEHPTSRSICPDGGNCRYSDCTSTAHPKRNAVCRDGLVCGRQGGCRYLHPKEWYGEMCPFDAACLFSDCDKTHTRPRPRPCRDGIKCSRAKQACGHLHPRDWYSESKFSSVDPWKIRFTHANISPKFRSGDSLDETIANIRNEKLSFAAFPAMEVFRLTKSALEDSEVIRSILAKFELEEDSQQAGKLIAKLRASAGEVFSLSNRRLFIARVLRTLGLLDKVQIQKYDFSSERVQRPERREEEDADNAKWLCALSTDSMGRSVHIHSGYRGFEEPGNAVHTFELPEVTTEEAALTAKRTIRHRVSQTLSVEHVACKVHQDVDDLFRVDVCVPPSDILKVEGVKVPSGEKKPREKKQHDHTKARHPKDDILRFLASQSGHSLKGKGAGKGSKGRTGRPKGAT